MTDQDNDPVVDAGKPDVAGSADPRSAGATDADKDHGVLYIGMDLGTSRTAISSSNGVRESIFSVVGYPKDHVAQKLLKRDVLVGRDGSRERAE